MVPGGPNEYLRNQILTASPEQLQMMLYDGAIRFSRQGREAIERKDVEGSYNALTRAQRIVLEMLNGLNHDVNPELCARMAALYTFVYRRLVEAGVQKDIKAVDDALRILEYQRETWRMLMEKLSQQRGRMVQAAPSTASPQYESVNIEG